MRQQKELQAEVERLRKDERRMDFVETQNGFIAGVDVESGKGRVRLMASHRWFPTLREALDAAMQQKG
jgi:hypothetical protein